MVTQIAGVYLSQLKSFQNHEAILPQETVHTAGNAGHWRKTGDNCPKVNRSAATFRAKSRNDTGWIARDTETGAYALSVCLTMLK